MMQRNDFFLQTGNMRFRRDNSALVIRPLPEEVVERHLRRRRSTHGDEYDSAMNSARHVVIKVKDYFPNFDFGEGESSSFSS